MHLVRIRRKKYKRNQTTAPPTEYRLKSFARAEKIELLSRFSIDLYGRYRTKPREASEIRRVTDTWNTPARLYPFLLFDMYMRRRRIPSVSKRTHDIPTMKDPRLLIFALTLTSMEGLDQGCDRRV